MKIARLDHILQQLGYATDEQIQEALYRQKEYGNRLGTHLLQLKFVTEDQLAHALSIQYEVPGYIPDMHPISPEAAKRLPLDFARQYLMLPMDVQPDTNELSLIVADPGADAAIASVKRHFNCTSIKLYVAPESIIKNLIIKYHGVNRAEENEGQRVKLPELFNTDAEAGEGTAHRDGASVHSSAEPANVLMIARTNFLKNYLVPIFEREGYILHIHSSIDEIEEVLQKTAFEHILVSPAMVDDFNGWLRQGRIPSNRAELSKFTSISDALLDNPVPYASVIHALHRSLEIVAEIRRNEGQITPPYHLICKDIQQLAALLGLKRIAVDGLQIAALLLAPKDGNDVLPPHNDETVSLEPSVDVDAALAYAHSLRFPWNLEDVLRAFRELFTGNRNPDESITANREVGLASQILAIVWFRHTCIRTIEGTAEDVLHGIRSELRKQSGRLVRPEIAEMYLRHIDRHRDAIHGVHNRQLFVVGSGNEITCMFATRLEHLGYRTVRISDLEEAGKLCARIAPAAIFIHDKTFPEKITDCRGTFGEQSPVLLYAITSESNPSYILELFDAGFDDIFAPPYDFNIIAARLDRSFRIKPTDAPHRVKQGGFAATFKAFAFIDLIQALGQSLKSVHIHLERGNGETAEIYMDHGKLIHAACADLKGAEVIYHIITWEEDGEFTVEPTEAFPTANITVSNESILMEGCRIFDESRA